jgi:hypothetical protein
MKRSRLARLHAIRADDAAGGIVFLFVFNDQVFAEFIELVGIEARLIRAGETFAQFDIENSEAQTARGNAILYGVGQSQTIAADFRLNAMRD